MTVGREDKERRQPICLCRTGPLACCVILGTPTMNSACSRGQLSRMTPTASPIRSDIPSSSPAYMGARFPDHKKWIPRLRFHGRYRNKKDPSAAVIAALSRLQSPYCCNRHRNPDETNVFRPSSKGSASLSTAEAPLYSILVVLG